MSRLLLLLLMLGIAGCATRQLPPTFVYTLQPLPNPAETSGNTGNLTLKLAPLRGTRPFATTRMLYTEHGIDQNSFAFSRWADSPTRMLQPLLVEAIHRSGLFQAVLPPGSTLRNDLSLEGTLLDFSLHLDDGNPRGVVEIRFILVDNHARQVVASRLFRAEAPATKADAEQAARALNQAAGEVTDMLVRWLTTLVSTRGEPG